MEGIKNIMRVLFTCSSGGHYEELLQLKKIINQNVSFLFTEEGAPLVDGFKQRFTVKQINRKENGFLGHFLILFLRSYKIFNLLKPEVIISTGALVTVPMLIIGKLKGAKIVYIESFARVYKPSLTGKIVYHFADIFIIQWKELKKYYPKAKYFGGIF